MRTELEFMIRRLKTILFVALALIIIEEIILTFLFPTPHHFRLFIMVIIGVGFLAMQIKTILDAMDYMGGPAGEAFTSSMRIAISALFLFLATAYFYPKGTIFPNYLVKHIFAICCLVVASAYELYVMSGFVKAKQAEGQKMDLVEDEAEDDEAEAEETEAEDSETEESGK